METACGAQPKMLLSPPRPPPPWAGQAAPARAQALPALEGSTDSGSLEEGLPPLRTRPAEHALHLIRAKTPWASSCIPGTVRDQRHYPTFRSKKQRFREHIQMSRLPAPDKGELEPSLVPLFA